MPWGGGHLGGRGEWRAELCQGHALQEGIQLTEGQGVVEGLKGPDGWHPSKALKVWSGKVGMFYIVPTH